ncbi:MAG: CYTH domain-containing protein [Lachnospiraceae bacterium]|nr:CYTH domain-containing protein [Lachnospiraceae bacterium]
MTDDNSYEIERKYLVSQLPDNLNSHEQSELEQGYLSTSPVVRVRRKDDDYILTYKSAGLMIRKEVELPLDKNSYEHLIAKSDGIIISKTRYIIPDGPHNIELDVFHGRLEGFVMAEVEFKSKEAADSYQPPHWFAKEVTDNPSFHNSRMSCMSESECDTLIAEGNLYRKKR